jgi:hypothetical protein
MSNKSIFVYTIVFLVFFICAEFILIWTDSDVLNNYLDALKSKHICDVASEYGLEEECKIRSKWLNQAYSVNVFYIMIRKYNDRIYLCEPGSVCNFEAFRMLDILITNIGYALPVFLILFCIYICISFFFRVRFELYSQRISRVHPGILNNNIGLKQIIWEPDTSY